MVFIELEQGQIVMVSEVPDLGAQMQEGFSRWLAVTTSQCC